jgi:hypothetical protein
LREIVENQIRDNLRESYGELAGQDLTDADYRFTRDMGPEQIVSILRPNRASRGPSRRSAPCRRLTAKPVPLAAAQDLGRDGRNFAEGHHRGRSPDGSGDRKCDR